MHPQINQVEPLFRGEVEADTNLARTSMEDIEQNWWRQRPERAVILWIFVRSAVLFSAVG